MKRLTLYSTSSRPRGSAGASGGENPAAAPRDEPAEAAESGARASQRHPGRISRFVKSYERLLLLAVGGLLAMVLAGLYSAGNPPPHRITQRDIDAAVLHTLKNKPLPSR